MNLPLEVWMRILDRKEMKSLEPLPLSQGKTRSSLNSVEVVSTLLREAARRVRTLEPAHIYVPSSDFPDIYSAVRAVKIFQDQSENFGQIEIRLKEGIHDISRTFTDGSGNSIPALPLVQIHRVSLKGLGNARLVGGTVLISDSHNIFLENLEIRADFQAPGHGVEIRGTFPHTVYLSKCKIWGKQIGVYVFGKVSCFLNTCHLYSAIQGLFANSGASVVIDGDTVIHKQAIYNIMCSGGASVEVCGFGPKPPGASYPSLFEGVSNLFGGLGYILEDKGQVFFV